MDLVQIASNTGDYLHTVFEVLEGLTDKFIGQFIRICYHLIGFVDFLQSKCVITYMAVWLAIISLYDF